MVPVCPRSTAWSQCPPPPSYSCTYLCIHCSIFPNKKYSLVPVCPPVYVYCSIFPNRKYSLVPVCPLVYIAAYFLIWNTAWSKCAPIECLPCCIFPNMKYRLVPVCPPEYIAAYFLIRNTVWSQCPPPPPPLPCSQDGGLRPWSCPLGGNTWNI